MNSHAGHCLQFATAILALTGAAARAEGAGSYEIATEPFVKFDDFIADRLAINYDTAYVVHPLPTEPGQKFPLISFAHGNLAGGIATGIIGHERMLENWASAGFVIVAPRSCAGARCLWGNTPEFAQDQRTVLARN